MLARGYLGKSGRHSLRELVTLGCPQGAGGTVAGVSTAGLLMKLGVGDAVHQCFAARIVIAGGAGPTWRSVGHGGPGFGFRLALYEGAAWCGLAFQQHPS